METVTPKQDRIGARVPHEVYETLCRAAELTGATVNQFLVQSALKEAQAVIEIGSEEAVASVCPQNRAYGSVHGSSCKTDPLSHFKPMR